MNKTLCALLFFILVIAFATNYPTTEGFFNASGDANAAFIVIGLILASFVPILIGLFFRPYVQKLNIRRTYI